MLAPIFGPVNNNVAGTEPVADSSQVVNEQSYTNLSVWSMTHSLPHRPSVEVYDAAGREIIAQVDHASVNQVVVTHNQPFSGSLRID